MKATGIVRRIDDLGRVVIPKDIRRTMNIREGDPLEVFTDRDGCIIFKKYVPNNLADISQQIVSALKALGIYAIVYDDTGSAINQFNAQRIDLEDETLKSSLFEIKDDEYVWGYVYIHGSVPNEFQQAQIEGVIAMALTNLY